jgi:hypothetical protein
VTARILSLAAARAARRVPCAVLPLESASERRIREARRRRAEQVERRDLVQALIDLGTDTPSTAVWLDKLTLGELHARVAEFRRYRAEAAP